MTKSKQIKQLEGRLTAAYELILELQFALDRCDGKAVTVIDIAREAKALTLEPSS